MLVKKIKAFKRTSPKLAPDGKKARTWHVRTTRKKAAWESCEFDLAKGKRSDMGHAEIELAFEIRPRGNHEHHMHRTNHT